MDHKVAKRMIRLARVEQRGYEYLTSLNPERCRTGARYAMAAHQAAMQIVSVEIVPLRLAE